MAASKSVFLLGLCLLLGACSSTPAPRSSSRSSSLNSSQGYYKVGSPYEIKGVTYTPLWDPDYDETGVASWYAGEFTGQPTANGELYDPNQLTAAHKTLPLPSLVRVTNLDNGRALIVRLNDRGPYAQNRIIDLSRRCAQLLGFEKKGTAKVRVQIMEKESLALADAARHGQLATSVADAIETNPVAAAPQVQVASNDAIAMPEIVSEPQPIQQAPVQSARIKAEPLPAPTTLSPAPPTSAERRENNTPLADSAGGLKVVNEKAVIKQETGVTPNGQSVGGRFLPAQKVLHEKVAPNSKLYVQAGAFSQLDNANRLRDKLHTLGTQILPVTVNGKPLYRVRIGPLANVPSADAELQRVIDAGATEAKIVVE